MTGSTKHNTLLGEYTLGLLSTSETAQAHALLGSDQQAVATALAWEHSLLELTDLLPPVDPSPLLLQRIQSNLGHDTTPTPASLYRKPDNEAQPSAVPTASSAQAVPAAALPASTAKPVATAPSGPASAPIPAGSPVRTEPALNQEYLEKTKGPAEPVSGSPVRTEPKASKSEDKLRAVRAEPLPQSGKYSATSQKKEKSGNIWFWRLTTVVFALASLALALIPSQPIPPPITILQVAPTQAAILQAPGQSSTPAWVVTVDPQRNILMSPKVRSDIPADASVQLWTHNKNMPAPRSLGLIDPNEPVTVPATLMGDIGPDQIFEMTQEPKGGSPTASPNGPVLFIGRMVTFGAPSPTTAETAATANKPPH